MKKEDFKNKTIRSRFLFGICSLQRAIYHWNFENLNWQTLFDFLIKYPNGNEIKDLGLWHQNESECSPFCILDSKPYEECYFEFISKSQYAYFKSLYNNVNKEVCEIIDLTAQIGTQSLYSGVRDGSPITLEYLFKIIAVLENNRIELPNIRDFEKFNYKSADTDWVVWGDKIELEYVINVLENNKTSSQQAVWQKHGRSA